MSSVDFLMEQPNVDTSRIAAYGLSYGGVAALYATAFDPRISELIYSNPPINFSIASTRPDFANAPLWFATTVRQ